MIDTISHSPMGEVIVFCLGLIFGSFYNVCIHRLPREESIVKPGSRCPQCLSAIPWYFNIPVVSYIWLKGRCNFCHKRISLEYLLVEIATGFIFLFIYTRYGWGKLFITQTVFISALWVSSIVDLHHQIIPDEISLGGIPVGLVAAYWTGDLPWWDPLLGILLGGGSFLAVSWIYEKITHREGLGGGDVKLLAMIGAWLGVKSILPVIVISSAIGSVVGILYMLIKRKGLKEAIPFGPFLAMGAVAQSFWGEYLFEFLFPFFTEGMN